MKDTAKKMMEILHAKGKYFVNIFAESLPEFANRLNLQEPLNLFEIVKQVNKDQCQKHLLIEEFDCSELTKEIAENTKRVLNNDNMKDTHVVIGARALMVNRKFKSKGHETIITKGHFIDETGMKKIRLNSNMRNPVATNKLLLYANEVVQQETTAYDYGRHDPIQKDVEKEGKISLRCKLKGLFKKKTNPVNLPVK